MVARGLNQLSPTPFSQRFGSIEDQTSSSHLTQRIRSSTNDHQYNLPNTTVSSLFRKDKLANPSDLNLDSNFSNQYQSTQTSFPLNGINNHYSQTKGIWGGIQGNTGKKNPNECSSQYMRSFYGAPAAVQGGGGPLNHQEFVATSGHGSFNIHSGGRGASKQLNISEPTNLGKKTMMMTNQFAGHSTHHHHRGPMHVPENGKTSNWNQQARNRYS